MDNLDYHRIAREFSSRKSLGQNFLISKDIASMEANYAKGMNVIELGPGTGILTSELCKTAKKIIAIEKDARLYELLKEKLTSKKLILINDDFFSVEISKFKKIDIMVSNIPYNLSSKVIYWLSANKVPALICIQKEFAEHMIAKPGTKSYSKLSVISTLCFKLYNVREVSAANFYPKPRVDSSIIYLIPKANELNQELSNMITLIMNHKKKKLRNAIMDSAKQLQIGKDQAKAIAGNINDADTRPLHMEPEQILEVAQNLNALVASLE